MASHAQSRRPSKISSYCKKVDETKKDNDSPQQLSKQSTKTVSEENQIDPAIMELGKSLYNMPPLSCSVCHQPTGKGITGAYPPLEGSEWVNGHPENMIRIHFRGLKGPITVKGTEYNSLMMPVAEAVFPSTNENVAAVLTYVRNSWGNTGSEITPEMVAKYQSEKDLPQLTVQDLIDPNTPEETKEATATVEVAPVLIAVPNTGLGSNIWATSGFLIVAGLCALAVLRMKAVNK